MDDRGPPQSDRETAEALNFGIDRIIKDGDDDDDDDDDDNDDKTNRSAKRQKIRTSSRAVFTVAQKNWLEYYFQVEKYITKQNRKTLASTLGLTDLQVKVWFQNRRMKWRHTAAMHSNK